MTQQSNIYVDGMAVHVFGHDDRAAHEWPCLEQFYGRTDFARTGMRYIAAAMCLRRRPEPKKLRKIATSTFRAMLRNSTTGSIVASRAFSVRMEAGETTGAARVDIALKPDCVNERYEYSLEICDHSGTVVHTSHKLRFHEPFLPTVAGACISDAAQREKSLRCIDRNCHDKLSVRFYFKRDFHHRGHMPELELCVRASDNIPRRYFISGGDYDFKTDFIVDCSTMPEGEMQMELLCMGRPLAGCTVMLGSEDKSGILRPEELLPLGYHHGSDEKASEDEDEFERLLEEFIASNNEDEEDEEIGECTVRSGAQDAGFTCETDDPIGELNAMVGLENVKAKIQAYRSMVQFHRLRNNAGLKCKMPPLHALFLGSPGTGKTTVASIMGRLLKQAGVLSSGHVVAIERADIVGRYYGDESKAITEALEKARGGILFIDEAYQLYRPEDPKDPGRIALESLLTALSDSDNRDWMLIMAGYTAPMMELMRLNPGLASRIPAANHYVFEDYSADELEQIAERYLENCDYTMSSEARLLLKRVLSADCARRDESFGNARHVLNLLETGVLPAMAERVTALRAPSVDDLRTICASDIPAVAVRPSTGRQRIGFAV